MQTNHHATSPAGIEERGGFKIPNLSLPSTRDFLDKKCKELDVECKDPRSMGRLLDKLVGHFIEDNITNPTFITQHPTIISPLACPS